MTTAIASKPSESVILLASGADPNPVSNPPFFCAPGAGGGVDGFGELASASALRRPFYGLETRTLPPKLRADFSIKDMARHFLPAIRQVQPAGPYFLGGYSTGGLIALELAHILLDAGEAVQPVIFIDTFAAAPAGLFWSLVKRFARAPLGEWKTIVRDGLGRHLEKARNPTAASPESEELEAIVENEKAGALNYIRRDLLFCRVPICLIVSGSPVRLEPDRGWSRFAKSGFERREVRGDHLSILRQPDVLELAALLKTFVDGST